MAKETRLNEDAQIYQPRDTRSEREKLQSMTRKEKLEYFNQYYRNKTIAIIVVLGFVAYLLYSMFGPKVQTVLYTAVLDGCVSNDEVTAFQSDMIDKLGLDTSKSTVVFDDSYYISSQSEYSASNQEKLVLYVSTGEIDIIIAPEEVFNQYASAGYFIKLSECLPADLFSSLTDNFLYHTTEDDSQEAAYGIYMDNYSIHDQNGTAVSHPVIGIVTNSKHKENAVTFIESLKFD